ncbi:ABC transporter permease [Paraflavitalea sp. CAU 1676]|uniref:ABC transporter permease n=1 Tax=Paraflavitalea sp. CAU 1676 TaxID=3032598 RepID=UPI0023DC6DE6|nr:ABC transporter permease [Paraflavitalea sp. CAU 1676]MDF2192012.1 ABC transporter permease [Paraflavitalea sp. CAU 1676]
MFKNHLKTAWRKLWKHKTESAIHLAGLSIGMTAAVLIMLWVQNEMSYDNYHNNGDRVYRITNHIPITPEETWIWENTPYALCDKAKQDIPEIEAMALMKSITAYGPPININGQYFKEKKGVYISKGWFDVFHMEFTEGTAAAFFQNPFSMLFSESAAKKYFGTTHAVGQLVKIDTVTYQVAGIMKDAPANSSFQFDMYIPIEAWQSNPSEKKYDLQWGNFNYISFIRLQPGTKPGTITQKLNKLLDQNRKDNKVTTSLMPLLQLHFDSTVQNPDFAVGNRQSVYIFAILAILILVVACINYVNLTTARASLRSKEVSVRKIVGAPRASLFAQFMAESLLTGLLALFITICLVQLSLPFFNRFTDQQFRLPIYEGKFWLLITGTLLTVTILTGIYPAILLSSFKPLNLFRGNSLLKLKDVTLRKVLVTTQFTVSVMLIAATLIIYKQLNYINDQTKGGERSQVLTFNVPWRAFKGIPKEKAAGIQQAFKQDLQSVAGVEQVAASNESLIDIRSSSAGNADWAGRPKDFEPSVVKLTADTDFPGMFGLKLTEGRWFHPNDANDANTGFILNETAIRELKITKPYVGQWFRFNNDSGQIVGIVKDFHFRSLHEAISPMIYHNGDQSMLHFNVKLTAKNAGTTIAAIEKIYKGVVPREPFEYTFLDESFEKLYRAERKMSTLMGVFAGIAIVISCLGLLGLAAFTAERRMKEIGIRKVLGASVHSIIGLLSKEFLLMVCIAALIATPIAWWAMSHWLEDFAYRVNIAPGIFALAGGVVLSVTLLIVGLHSWRAASSNPVKSLRSE